MPKHVYVRYKVNGHAEFRFNYDQEGVDILRALPMLSRTWMPDDKCWIVFSEPFISETIRTFENHNWVIHVSREVDEEESRRRQEREAKEREEQRERARQAREKEQARQRNSRSEDFGGNRARGSASNGSATTLDEQHYEKVFREVFRLVPYEDRDKLYKALARVFHPDAGGDETKMKMLNKVADR